MADVLSVVQLPRGFCYRRRENVDCYTAISRFVLPLPDPSFWSGNGQKKLVKLVQLFRRLTELTAPIRSNKRRSRLSSAFETRSGLLLAVMRRHSFNLLPSAPSKDIRPV